MKADEIDITPLTKVEKQQEAFLVRMNLFRLFTLQYKLV